MMMTINNRPNEYHDYHGYGMLQLWLWLCFYWMMDVPRNFVTDIAQPDQYVH